MFFYLLSAGHSQDLMDFWYLAPEGLEGAWLNTNRCSTTSRSYVCPVWRGSTAAAGNGTSGHMMTPPRWVVDHIASSRWLWVADGCGFLVESPGYLIVFCGLGYAIETSGLMAWRSSRSPYCVIDVADRLDGCGAESGVGLAKLVCIFLLAPGETSVLLLALCSIAVLVYVGTAFQYNL